MITKKKAIVLILFRRYEKTIEVLTNLREMKKIEEFELIVVRQEGCDRVKKIVDSIDWIRNTHYVTKYSEERSTKYKINQNVRLGLSKAFEAHDCDYAVLVEDDVVLGYDFLEFCDHMHNKYACDKSFRAINAFSKEPYLESRLFDYGMFRFGVGYGWSINQKAWRSLRKFWPENRDCHFDALIEPWVRTGFVIMPYCSRCKNIGWGDGQHTPTDMNHEFYQTLLKSFVGSNSFPIKEYNFIDNMKYVWRDDCFVFKRFDISRYLRSRIWLAKANIKFILRTLSYFYKRHNKETTNK